VPQYEKNKSSKPISMTWKLTTVLQFLIQVKKLMTQKNYYSLYILIVNFELIHDSLHLNYNIIKNDHPSSTIRVSIAQNFIGNNLFIYNCHKNSQIISTFFVSRKIKHRYHLNKRNHNLKPHSEKEYSVTSEKNRNIV